MQYLIADHNGNPYTDISPTRATLYRDKKKAFEVLKDLPSGYTVRETLTRKEVKS